MLDVIKFIWYTMIENETNDFVWYCRTFTKGGQYIDKILGRIKKSPSYNDMGESKLEENKNLFYKEEPIFVDSYELDGTKVRVESFFVKRGKSMVDRLLDLFASIDDDSSETEVLSI